MNRWFATWNPEDGHGRDFGDRWMINNILITVYYILGQRMGGTVSYGQTHESKVYMINFHTDYNSSFLSVTYCAIFRIKRPIIILHLKRRAENLLPKSNLNTDS